MTYDSASGIPANAELEVTELTEGTAGYDSYVQKAAETLGTEVNHFAFAHAFDISLIDPATGKRYQPSKDVKVSIDLLKENIQEGGEINVVHFPGTNTENLSGKVGEFGGKRGTHTENLPEGEILEANVNGEAVEFESSGFSVYVVAYTVDFHWGNYTYNLEGGSTFFLSELLETLINGASESGNKASEASEGADGAVEAETSAEGTENRSLQSGSAGVYANTTENARLAEIIADMSQVKSVTFSNPKLVKVEQKSSEQAENDWLLTSLAAFDTEEILTIRLADGSEIEVRVTDATDVTIDGVTYTLNNNGTATVKATGTSITQTYVIKNSIVYNGNTYAVNNLGGSGATNDKIYNGKKVILEDALVSAITQNRSIVLPADDPNIVDVIPDSVSSMIAGDQNSTAMQKLWKQTTVLDDNRVQIDLSFFQSRKSNDAKIGFIFLLDETDTMAGNLPPAVAPGYTMQRRLYSRSLLKMFTDSIIGTDNRMDMIVYGDFGSNAERFRTTGVCTPEEFKINIFDNYITGAAGGAGLRAYIGTKMATEFAAMKTAGYTPVIITLSDYAWGDPSNDFKNIQCNKYAVGVIDGNESNRKEWTEIGSTQYPSRSYKGSDLESFISAMEAILLDAVSSISSDTKVVDELSSPLKGTITSPAGTHTDSNGKLTISDEGMTWEFTDNNGEPLPAGVLYTKRVICDLKTKDEVASGSSNSNGNCTVQ